MRFLKTSVGFLAVLGVIPGASALTSRASMVATATSRVPTISHFATGTSSTGSSSTTSSTLLQNAECIEAYTDCMKGADACGPNFEECTTNVLFHAKMPQCLGTLAQCSSNGVNSLFGTSTVSALSTVAEKNSYGEVTRYTYPTDGSVLGQLITGAAISNRYDTSTCVRRYTSCLKKDNVCGENFELCTTNTEFRKQRVFCDSTLARCQAEGILELLGSTNTTAAPTANSRIGEMISEGAALAAVSAVSTCYKVIDQCILGACATNPYKCYDGASETSIKLVETINNGGDISAVSSGSNGGIMTLPLAVGQFKVAELNGSSSISGYIRNACQSTIGANKYCYATFLGNGMMPTASQLNDEDNQAEIYAQAYSARMNDAMKANIKELVNQFDTKAKSKCVDTVKSCAMRVCGSGSGAACYAQVFGSGVKSINKSGTWEEIKTGCSAVVNSDLYCKYAAENPNNVGTYNYTFNKGDAFDVLFPEYEDGGNDPIGVVASLNASLATSYSDAAITQMKKQCQSVATSCVKSLCGDNYTSCYRNRTDVYSSLTQTGEPGFDRSMNKVGGVLDYTIVLGLCLDTVKNASVCEEHLAIETNKLKMANNNNSTSSWGGASNVREGWIDAGAATSVSSETETVQATDENGNNLCSSKTGEQGICYTVDRSGNVFDTPVKISYTTYVQSQAASSLFKDLIYDLEKEAQAKYNAALTREQNACMAQNNNSGIMGNRDTGSTYMWVKLRSNKIPTNYSTAGLKTSQFVASNDIYNSFCRIRVTMQSDDKKIQDVLSNGASWSTAYFATGDVFTCGSWIPESELANIAHAVAKEETADKQRSMNRTKNWLTVLGSLGGGVGGIALGEGIRKGNILGGLTGFGETKDTKKTTNKTKKSQCSYNAEYAADFVRKYNGSNGYDIQASDALKQATKSATELDKIRFTITINEANEAFNAWKNASNKTDHIDCGKNPNTECNTFTREAADKITALKSKCDSFEEDDEDEDEESKSKNGWITGVTTVATSIAGGVIVNRLVNDVQKTQMDAAKKAIYDEWMSTVGRHLTCYVGDQEIGYGDTVAVSLEY